MDVKADQAAGKAALEGWIWKNVFTWLPGTSYSWGFLDSTQSRCLDSDDSWLRWVSQVS